jgi:hypothetical protein
LYISIRSRWILWKIEEYKINALWYGFKTKQSSETMHEMSVVWPISNILLEAWRWDFKRYVVDHGHYDNMMKFIEQEKQKESLAMVVNAPPAGPGTDDEEDDPGDNIDNFSTAKKPVKKPIDPDLN